MSDPSSELSRSDLSDMPKEKSDSAATDSRFPRVPPQWIMVSVALLAAVCLWAAVTLATRAPWLGLELAPETKGIRVSAVAADGPSAVLAAGQLLVAIRTEQGEVVPVDGASLVDDPETYPTYADYNRFFAQQRKVYAALNAPSVTMILSDGREVVVSPVAKRPLRQLGRDFWGMALFSVLVLQLGAGMWIFRRDRPATGLVALTGVGYMMSTLTFGIYSTREWVLGPSVFWWLAEFNHLGNILFAYAALALLWSYPRAVGRRLAVQLCLIAVIPVWLNELLQLFQWPWHAFHLQYFVPYLLGLWAGWEQWKATRQHPDERAALQWFLLSVLISISIVMLLNFLPELFSDAPLIPNWVGQLMLSGLYLGLILGILRYRLFDLERWWFGAWLWFLGGLIVVLADVFLMYVVDLRPIGALSLSIVVVGWVYFPARQWLWSRFVRSPSQRLEAYLPMLLEAFFSASSLAIFQERWQRLLAQIFDPLDVSAVAEARSQACLEQSGLVLTIPDIQDDGRHLRLSGRSRGNRLFTPDDVRLASFVLALARKSAGLRAAQERGATLERERIARDLHDDVAPHLLTLIHRSASSEIAEGARTALQTLRESIYVLNDPRAWPLDKTLAEWRRETTDRVEAAGIRMEWRQPGDLDGILLNPRQYLNLARVLREGVTNAVRHAAPTNLKIDIGIVGQRLTVRLVHDGLVTPPANWLAGNGLANMRTRINELGGCIEWRTEQLPPSDKPSSLHVLWDAPFDLDVSRHHALHP